MLRILILALAVLTAFVPFVPAIVFAAVLVAFAIAFAARPLRRTQTLCADQPVALFALVSFRAPPALV